MRRADGLGPIDTLLGAYKSHYVNRVANALLKATRISIGVSGSIPVGGRIVR